MNNNKEAERAELHKIIWRIANDLRGSVDGWDFKTYVLGMLFYRFISENLAAYLNTQERKASNPDFDYATLSDADAEFGRMETVTEKGFYILPSRLFANVRSRARTDANLNETLSRVFADIEGSAIGADSEDDFKGLFDDLDVNSSKLGPRSKVAPRIWHPRKDHLQPAAADERRGHPARASVRQRQTPGHAVLSPPDQPGRRPGGAMTGLRSLCTPLTRLWSAKSKIDSTMRVVVHPDSTKGQA